MVLFFSFLVDKRMERREMIKRKIKNLEKDLEKVIFKNNVEDCLVVFNIGKRSGSLSYYSMMCSSLEILSASS